MRLRNRISKRIGVKMFLNELVDYTDGNLFCKMILRKKDKR